MFKSLIQKILSNNYEWTYKLVKKQERLALASLICGIVGGTFWVFSIPSIICGHIFLDRIRMSPNTYNNKKMAIAGLILGYLGFIWGIAFALLNYIAKN